MRFSDSLLNEIKARLRLSDLIGQKVKLRRAGKEWVGLSPFTAEKSPSFYVNDEKQFFKDFSSGKSGDCFTWLIEAERLTFPEAVERLAELTGVPLPADTHEEKARDTRRDRLLAIVAQAHAFFVNGLKKPAAAEARRYLDGRGFTPADCQTYGLGYAPDGWRGLLDHLTDKGVAEDDIIAAGLAIKPDGRPNGYDRFRNRIIFPIGDAAGRVISFGGRALTPEDKPKYLNGPDSDLFHKGQVLYRFNEARKALGNSSGQGLIVCEGYMDVLALARAGFGHAVAPLGTALTAEQLGLVWRAGGKPVLCFDGDAAGLRAAHASIDRALPLITPEQTLSFVLLPDKMDPDDLIRARGAGAMGALLEQPLALVDVLWMRERDRETLDTPESLAGLEARVMKAAGAIGNEGVRRAYQAELGARLREFLWQRRRVKTAGPAAAKPSYIGRPENQDGWKPGQRFVREPVEDITALRTVATIRGLPFILRAVDSPELFTHAVDDLVRARFADSDVQAICDAALELDGLNGVVDRETLEAHLRQLGKSRAGELVRSFSFPDVIDPGSELGRDWLSALARFVASQSVAADAREAGQLDTEAGPEQLARAMVRQKQIVAERHRLRTEGEKRTDGQGRPVGRKDG
jgi:DNA primase